MVVPEGKHEALEVGRSEKARVEDAGGGEDEEEIGGEGGGSGGCGDGRWREEGESVEEHAT